MSFPKQSHYNLNLIRKPTLRLCSSSPKVSVFERQLSLMKTPTVLQDSLDNSPNVPRYHGNSNGSTLSDDQYSTNSSDATLVGSGDNFKCTNSLLKYEATVKLSPSTTISSTTLENKTKNLIEKSKSIELKIPVQEIINLKTKIESLINESLNVFHSITRDDIDLLLTHLSEAVIGVFVVFGAEIMRLNKDGFLVLVQLVTASAIKICFKNDNHDSLFLQSSIQPVLERSNLTFGVKKSLSHLITTLHFYILFSTLRITSIFKNNYMIEESKIDSLSIMVLGTIMVLMCLNLIFNSLPASRYYTKS